MKSTESNQLQLLPYPPPLGWTLESSSILDANARSSVSPQLSFTSPADARSSASPQPSVTEPADTQSSISSPLMPDVNTVALRNNSSGMRFILSNSGSSIVHCTIIVPTAAATNHGAPHAVEHMVFQGSEKLPKPGSLFKVSAHLGIIDFGAVTHQDCTIYYYTAVDAKSAIAFVPILIESLRRPQFNHNSYLSEIHHVRSNGDAAGVMLSEILEKMNIKNDARDIVRRFLSPPNSPYHFSDGRVISEIQRLTYNEIKRCHAEYYHPQFFNCIITGAGVTARALFDTMDESLNDLSTSSESPTVSALPRPLHIPKWPLGAKSLEYRVVNYPSSGDSSDINEICYHSFGIALDDHTTIKGVETLLLCLTSPGGPIHNAFCTTDFGNSQQPWSSNVEWGMANYELMEYYIHLIDVNADLIEEEPTPESFEKSVVHSRLRKVFEHVYNHGFSRPFIDGTNPTKKAGWNEADLNYIRGFLSASMVSDDDDAQDEQPFSKTYHNKVVEGFRRYQLYDFSPSEVSLRSKNERIDLNKLSSPIDDITLSGKLMKEGIKFWRGLFKDYIRSANWLAVLAYPDESLASELDNQPQQLVEKRHSGVITESMPDYLDKSTSVGDLSKHHEVLINAMQTSKQPFSSKDYKNWPSPPSNATEIHLPATSSQFIRITDLPQSRKQLQKLASLQHQLPVRGIIITATESNTSCIDLKLPLHGLSRRSAAYIDLLVVCIMNSNTFVHSGSITDSDTDFHIDICRSTTPHEVTLDLHAEFTLGNRASSNVTSASSSSYSQNAASYPTAIHTLFNRFINSVFSNDSVHGALDSISGKSIDDDPTDVAFNRLLMSTTPPSADSLDSELFASTNATEPVSHHSLYGNGSFNSYLAPFAQKSFAAALDELLSTGNSKKGLGLICSRLNEARESIFALNGLNACDFPVYCDDGNINGSVKARIPGVLHIGIGTMDGNATTIDQIGKEIAYEACRQWSQALSKYCKQNKVKVNNKIADINKMDGAAANLPFRQWFPSSHDLMSPGTRVYAYSNPKTKASYFKMGINANVQTKHRISMSLLLHILNQASGPLFNTLRGAGVAYDISIDCNFDAAILSISVGPAAAPVQAMNIVISLIRTLSKGSVEWDRDVASRYVKNASIAQMACENLLKFKDSGLDRMNELLRRKISGCSDNNLDTIIKNDYKKMREVTAGDLLHVFKEYVQPMIQPETSKLVVWAAPPRMIEKYGDQFTKEVPGSNNSLIEVDCDSLMHSCPKGFL